MRAGTSLTRNIVPAISSFAVAVIYTTANRAIGALPPNIRTNYFLPINRCQMGTTCNKRTNVSTIPCFCNRDSGMAVIRNRIGSISLATFLTDTIVHPRVTSRLIRRCGFCALAISRANNSKIAPSRALAGNRSFFISKNGNGACGLVLTNRGGLNRAIARA